MVRYKSRYFVVKVKYADDRWDLNIYEKDIKEVIKTSVEELYGDYGIATYCNKMFVKYVNPYTQIFFVQCARDYHKEIRTAISFVKQLRSKFCTLTCIYMGATIKSAERFLLDYNTKTLQRLYANCKDPMEKRRLMQVMANKNIATDVLGDPPK